MIMMCTRFVEQSVIILCFLGDGLLAIINAHATISGRENAIRSSELSSTEIYKNLASGWKYPPILAPDGSHPKGKCCMYLANNCGSAPSLVYMESHLKGGFWTKSAIPMGSLGLGDAMRSEHLAAGFLQLWLHTGRVCDRHLDVEQLMRN